MSMFLCNSCRTELPVAARFCHSCGSATSSGPQQISQIQSSFAQHQQPVVSRGVVQNVHYTDVGAAIDFINIGVNDVANLVGGFFTQMGFRLESGSPLQGTFGKGSAAARVAVGAFVTREKYDVKVNQFGSVFRVEISSGMSGMGGGFIGVSREKTARNAFKQSLGLFLQQLSR